MVMCFIISQESSDFVPQGLMFKVMLQQTFILFLHCIPQVSQVHSKSISLHEETLFFMAISLRNMYKLFNTISFKYKGEI